MDQLRTPLYEALMKHVKQNPVSFHVPGHKNGNLFVKEPSQLFSNLLKYDQTELRGLDDLHQPEGAINEAQILAAELYKVKRTFFLVNGSTSGNLAMILSACKPGKSILVQRNSHKSVMHGLQLAGAKPIFFSPEFDKETGRSSIVNVETIKAAIEKYPDIKAIVLTYPDYFGSTYDLTSIVEYAHNRGIPVLVDEAHGAHFVLGDPFPKSAIECGADLIIHSAHKTLPAMTMGSYLHFQSDLIDEKTVRHYLQIVQSSSPSYLIMASLDLARKYVAQYSENDKDNLLKQIDRLRELLKTFPLWDVENIRTHIDDPLKITLTSNQYSMTKVERWLNDNGIYPEMVQNNQLLLIAGLEFDDATIKQVERLKDVAHDDLTGINRGTMNDKWYKNTINELPISYDKLQKLNIEWLHWDEAVGQLAAESIIPYPPGIPFLLKGEMIEKEHVQWIQEAINEKIYLQYNGKSLAEGIEVFRID